MQTDARTPAARQRNTGAATVPVGTRLTEAEAEHLDRLAAERGQTRSYVVASLLREGLRSADEAA